MLTRNNDHLPEFRAPDVTVGKWQGNPMIGLSIGRRYILIDPDDIEDTITGMRDVAKWINDNYEDAE